MTHITPTLLDRLSAALTLGLGVGWAAAFFVAVELALQKVFY